MSKPQMSRPAMYDPDEFIAMAMVLDDLTEIAAARCGPTDLYNAFARSKLAELILDIQNHHRLPADQLKRAVMARFDEQMQLGSGSPHEG